ncbi:hypothetical protein HY948_01675 [Candidatus Gottesmanbacteria bacterium]|nr:hypothetical protein [Candidatus Gottesmanbacteria bacterium]
MQHRDLEEKRWAAMPLVEQMANIGSEVIRFMKWKGKNNHEYAHLALLRALELFDLTLTAKTVSSELREVARARELWLDYSMGDNQYRQTASQWEKYFTAFAYAARQLR